MDNPATTSIPRTCVLKVYLHCPACEKKVRKVLEKINGVNSVVIEREDAKVTVSGAIDPGTLLRVLKKTGKKAEILWDSSSIQMKNDHISNVKNTKTDAIGSQEKGRVQKDSDKSSEVKGLKQYTKTNKSNSIDHTTKTTANSVAEDSHGEQVQHRPGGGCCGTFSDCRLM